MATATTTYNINSDIAEVLFTKEQIVDKTAELGRWVQVDALRANTSVRMAKITNYAEINLTGALVRNTMTRSPC